MNPKEIKNIMAIVRPAITAMYGRQKLELAAYNQMGENYLWIQVEGAIGPDEKRNYKLRLEEGKVTYLAIGELS